MRHTFYQIFNLLVTANSLLTFIAGKLFITKSRNMTTVLAILFLSHGKCCVDTLFIKVIKI